MKVGYQPLNAAGSGQGKIGEVGFGNCLANLLDTYSIRTNAAAETGAIMARMWEGNVSNDFTEAGIAAVAAAFDGHHLHGDDR